MGTYFDAVNEADEAFMVEQERMREEFPPFESDHPFEPQKCGTLHGSRAEALRCPIPFHCERCGEDFDAHVRRPARTEEGSAS